MKKLNKRQEGYLELLGYIMLNLVSGDEAYKYQYSDEEKFRIVDGYEDYVVSNTGRVISLPKANYFHMAELTPQLIGGGSGKKEHKYHAVRMSKDGQSKYEYVHRLVGFAFVPGWFPDAEINHKDEEKLNNQAANLEWCDRSYNKHFGDQYDRMIETRRRLQNG